MSKKQWGVLVIDDNNGYNTRTTVCDVCHGDGKDIQPAKKQVCKDFIVYMNSVYPCTTYQLFKFKIKETI